MFELCFESDWSSLVTLACDVLRGNGVIGLPTDTVYGIATLAQSATAVKQLYDVKGRNSTKPVAISVAEVSDVHRSMSPPPIVQ